MNDKEIIQLLRSKKEGKALKKLYRYFPQVQKLIVSKGGQKQDAQDVFQDALVVFCSKLEQSDFKLTASIDTYLYSVCKLIWNNQQRKRKTTSNSELEVELDSNDLEELNKLLEKEELLKRAEQVLLKLGKRCQDLLKLFYFDGLRMKVIAEKMGFKSEKIAKNQKYKCMERAKLQLKDASTIYRSLN